MAYVRNATQALAIDSFIVLIIKMTTDIVIDNIDWKFNDQTIN